METQDTLKLIVVGGGVIILILLVATFCITQVIGNGSGLSFVQKTPVVTSTPEPTSVPVVIQQVQIPSTVSFTALKASAAQANAVNLLDRQYTVLTTNGDILIFSDYYSWDAIIPQQSYSCNVVSEPAGYGRTVYSVSNCQAYWYQNPVTILYGTDNYYPYYDGYYPYDRSHCYDRNTGKYNEQWCENNDASNDLHDWNANPYTFYHYRGQYWRCTAGTCESVGITRIPSYVTIHEEVPPFSRYN